MSDNNNERNYYCLTKLLLVEGLRLVRACVECHLREGIDVYQTLIEKRGRLEKLMRNRRINAVQLGILYPKQFSQQPNLSKIDMTLWCVLARNITVSKLRDDQWNNSPEPMDQSWEYDIMRLRDIRNEIAHLPTLEIDDLSFNIYWLRLRAALEGLEDEVQTIDRIDFDRYRQMAWNQEEQLLLELQLKEEMRTESMNTLAQEKKALRKQFYILLAFLGLVLIGSLTLLLLYTLQPKPITCADQLQYKEVGIVGVLRYLDRVAWNATAHAPSISERLPAPVPYVIISHTAYAGICSTTELCCKEVKYIQGWFMGPDKGYADIPYHYLIDVNGIVFEGRSFHYKPSAVLGWNNRTISIAFMGNFQWQHPSDSALAALESLLAYLIDYSPERLKVLAKNYTLFGACQVRNTASPGRHLYEQLGRFLNYKNSTNKFCGK